MKNIIKISRIVLLLVLIQFTCIKSQVVCSEDEFVRELREDILDNGRLDCLRVIKTPEQGETSEQKNRREAAQWDSDCSFEANNKKGNADWVKKLVENYDLKKGLVDVYGKPMQKELTDFSDQADMCEIARALIANGKVDGYDDVTNLDEDVVHSFDCVGEEGQTEVCAATSGSYGDQQKWYILLEGAAMKFGKKPVFNLATNS